MWPWVFHRRATMGRNRCSAKSSSTSNSIRGRPSFQTGYENRAWTCRRLWRLWFNLRIRFWWRQTSLYYYSRLFWLRHWALKSSAWNCAISSKRISSKSSMKAKKLGCSTFLKNYWESKMQMLFVSIGESRAGRLTILSKVYQILCNELVL